MNQSLMELIAYYTDQGAPGDQQMLIALLREAQEADGGALADETLQTIARVFHIKVTMLQAIIRRIPALRTADVPHRLEICQTCKKGAALRAMVEREFGIQSGQSCAGFSYHAVPCMKNCRFGPSVRWDGELVPDMDENKLRKLLKP